MTPGVRLWLGGVLAAAVVGIGTAWLIPRPPAEGSAEVGLARTMSAHQQQAVEMSVILFKRSSDPEVARLSQDLFLTGQAQIGQMTGWLMAWGRPVAGQQSPFEGLDRTALGLISPAEMQQLRHLSVPLAETRYLVLLRCHVRGSLALAQERRQRLRQPEVQTFVERLIRAQRAEVQVIDRLILRRLQAGEPAQPETGGLTHE